ncbi:hypothetical protein ABMA70_09895 [Halobacteriovorax sp. XZX-3]|uniref:hypothetical protein n=1 Tax=unclassified Halobacteriovorax TaxID=2639665 RepID=UPI003719455B
MLKFNLSLIVVLLLSVTSVFSNNSSIFNDHKLRTYTPLEGEIQDLFFDIREPNLEKYVRANTALEPDDVYYRVYWVYPNNIRIRVEGLPEKGFDLLKQTLIAKVKPYVELVLAKNLTTPLEMSAFKKDPKNNSRFIRVKDQAELLDLSIELYSSGQIKEIESSSPQLHTKTSFSYSKKSWAKGKSVISQISISEGRGASSILKEIEIEYEKFGTFGLPSNIEAVSYAITGDKKVELGKLDLKIQNYQINTGQAKKIIGL